MLQILLTPDLDGRRRSGTARAGWISGAAWIAVAHRARPGPSSVAPCGPPRTCGRTRGTWSWPPLMAVVVSFIALPDQDLAVRHHEQAGLADPSGRRSGCRDRPRSRWLHMRSGLSSADGGWPSPSCWCRCCRRSWCRAVSYQRPELPPGRLRTTRCRCPGPRPHAVQARELQRSQRLSGGGARPTAPVQLPGRPSPTACRPSCWLRARRPIDLGELRQMRACGVRVCGVMRCCCAPASSARLGSHWSSTPPDPDVRLLSSPTGFATSSPAAADRHRGRRADPGPHLVLGSRMRPTSTPTRPTAGLSCSPSGRPDGHHPGRYRAPRLRRRGPAPASPGAGPTTHPACPARRPWRRDGRGAAPQLVRRLHLRGAGHAVAGQHLRGQRRPTASTRTT